MKGIFDKTAEIREKVKQKYFVISELMKKLYSPNRKIQVLQVLLLSSCLTFLCVEALNRNSLWKAIVFGFQISNQALLTYAVIFLSNVLVYMLFNHLNVSTVLTFLFYTIFAMISHYKMIFRGDPFLPTDLISTRDAVDIMGKLDFVLTFQVFVAIIAIIGLIAFWFKNRTAYKIKNHWIRLSGIGFSMVLIAAIIMSLGNETYKKNNGIRINLFRQNRTYSWNGFLVSFVLNAQYLKVDVPENYTEEAVQAVIDEAKLKPEQSSGSAIGKKKKPNLIFIMSETYSDLSYIRDLGLEEEVTPFYNSLKNNTVKGKLNVPIIGAGTANTEFEVLTGLSTKYLPKGSMAYPQYVHTETESILTQLKRYGYTNIANHPYGEKFWKRKEVYPLLGFDDFVSEEDYVDPKMRGQYISDEACYRQLIQQYNKYKDDGPVCLFNVTMQNHMPFTRQEGEKEFAVEGVENSERVNNYLSGLNTSDKQLKRLIKYFNKADEDVMIVLFGDHLPSLSDENYSDLFGMDYKSIAPSKDMEKSYQTPFFVWANYDIQEKRNVNISSNFLGQYVMDMAGFELSPFFKFNQYLYNKLPVINGSYAVDKRKNSYYSELEVPEKVQKVLDDYELIQYDLFFGNKYFQKILYQ